MHSGTEKMFPNKKAETTLRRVSFFKINWDNTVFKKIKSFV